MIATVQQIANQLHPYFASRPVQKVYLFGSRVRGEETETSDYDFLLEMNRGSSIFDMGGIQVELEEMLKTKVDVVSVNGISPRLKPYIEEEKVLIYEQAK